ncbi:MAG: hypothetical protein OXP66_07315 [Candidatus Tectomicrobia bacterium]|nr:hypothetical protein [Candidatus Tectomicrobia bacterium]
MPRPPARLKELTQYIEDLEVGVAIRLDDFGARLAATERNLAAIDKRLGPPEQPEAGLAERSDTDAKAERGHA